MYTLTVEDNFASAHQLRGYQGKCENIHGHNWRVQLSIKGKKLDNIGLLIDYNDIKSILKSVIDALDHKNINDIPPFDTLNPSSENIAKYVSDQISDLLKRYERKISVDSVTIWESGTSRCKYVPC